MKNAWISHLAFLNLRRYGRRSLITAGAIAFGLCFYIWVDSILTGAAEESLRNLRLYETASGAMAGGEYLENRESAGLDEAFPWRDAAEELALSRIAAAPRITFAADLVFYKDPFPEDGSIPVLITAIDPLRDAEVFGLEQTLGEGSWIEEGRQGLVLGRWLADAIGATPGASLMAVTSTRDGYAQVIDLEVAGIIDSPNPEVNNKGAYVPLDIADTCLEMGGEVTVLNLAVPGAMKGMSVRGRDEALSAAAGDFNLEWYPW